MYVWLSPMVTQLVFLFFKIKNGTGGLKVTQSNSGFKLNQAVMSYFKHLNMKPHSRYC